VCSKPLKQRCARTYLQNYNQDFSHNRSAMGMPGLAHGTDEQQPNLLHDGW